MSETRLLVCEGACNPYLRELDEQRLRATKAWSPVRDAMPAMPDGWLDAMRAVRHTAHHREAPGFMGNIWTCQSCGASRRW